MNRENSFDILRLVAAGMVLVSHQFALLGMNEPIVLGEKLGTCGLYVFFVISGFLVMQSWDRDPNLPRFFLRRGLRLFPALVVLVVLTVFVLGPLISTLTASDYFNSAKTWKYFTNVFLSIRYELPGVFESNPLPNAVNGSLWSLRPEMVLYCCLALAGILSISSSVFIALSATTVVLSFVLLQSEVFHQKDLLALSAYFSAGIVIHRYRMLLSRRSLVLSSVVAFAVAFAFQQLALWMILPLLTLQAAHLTPPAFKSRLLFGDWSYGIYLYAFPVQQTIALLGVRNYVYALSLSAFITVLLAMFSWHFVEAKALRWKPVVQRATQPSRSLAALDRIT